MATTNYSNDDRHKDVAVLHSMGYAQELERRMSAFSNYAVSFSIICILSDGINSLGQATAGAGGASLGIGWPVGCVISGVFALGMAQIASAYPTAGGLYHWSSILGGRFAGWLTAWLNLLGLITVLGAINAGTWGFFGSSIGAWFGVATDASTTEGFRNQIVFVAAITFVQAIINHFGIRLTARLTDFSGYLIFAVTIVLTLACFAFAEHWDWSRIWTFHNYTGDPTLNAANELKGDPVWPSKVSMTMAFLLSLLLPIYTITGYDASVHTSEETQHATLAVPRAIVSSIMWGGAIGYLLLVAFLLMLPDLDQAASQGWNVFFWAMQQRVPAATRNVLYALIFLAQALCGLATVTSASRMIYAFARDGGLPAASLLASVSPRLRTPAAAIWSAAIAALLFVWGAKWLENSGAPVYSVVVSCTVIFLYLSCVVPIALGLIAYGGPKWPRMGPWTMGRAAFSSAALLSVASMLGIFILGVQPPNQLAFKVTIGFVLLSVLVWFGFERRRFRGPPRPDMQRNQ